MSSQRHAEVSLELPASKLTLRQGALALVLRPHVLADAPAVVEAVQESLPQLRQFMPWAHREQTLETQLERLKACQADYWRGGDQVLGVFDAGSGDFLGSVGLHRRTLNPRGLELGYWTRTRAAGRGVATLASRMLIAYCFEYLGCERVQCGFNEANARSRRVFEKCGFVLEGTLRNFEPTPTLEQRRNGLQLAARCLLGGLVPEDVPGLPWFEEVARALEVDDWRGARAPRPRGASR
jgi:RimJ/RimL family protein N-acetyltransferase